MSNIKTDFVTLKGANNRAMLCDITYNAHSPNSKLVLFLHGFKSFANWGPWPWMAQEFANMGYTFFKLNFSHNGVGATPETAADFIDLNAFGENNFQKQMQDLAAVMLNINTATHCVFNNIDKQNIIIIGHSMGGGMAILAGAKYKNISHLITLNSMSNFTDLFKRYNLNEWQQTGKVFVDNARTKQQMPLHYQLYENYMQHQSELNLSAKAALVTCKWLLVYATKDETVLPSNAQALQLLNSNISLCAIENTGHTFDATHPFDVGTVSKLKEVLEKVFLFLNPPIL